MSVLVQKKITHILSTVQRAIEAQERIIQTTTELKKALMHKLFTEGLRNEPQRQTEIGPVTESWTQTTLGELCEKPKGALQTGPFGSQLHKDEYQENGIAVVNRPTLMGTVSITRTYLTSVRRLRNDLGNTPPSKIRHSVRPTGRDRTTRLGH